MNFKPVFEIFTFINMKYIDFLKHVREYENYDMCLESINKNYGRNNEKVSLEALLKMSVLCKTISGIENYKLLIYKRSGSNGFEIYKTSIKKILFEKINNGSKSGKVDIIIFNEKKEFVLISSKLFDNKIVKNFKDYDIDDNFIATKNELIKRGFCDTDKFCGIITNCFKKNLLKFTNRNGENNSINEKSLDDKFLFGLEEINKMYENLRLYLLNINDENLLEKIEKTNNFQKKRLYLKFHQRYISNLLQQKIENNKSKYYLLGCAPRVGKSYIMADIILKNDFRNVLIISRLKTNLKEGFEELYDEYCNFEENNYNTYLYNYETSDLNLDNKNIVVDTLQSVQKDTSLYNKFDVVFYDESHIGSGAEFLRDDLEHYINDTGITIFVSATFKKTKDKFDISLNDCVFFGDYEISQLKTKDKNLLDKMKNTGITDDEIENFHYPTINIYNFDLVDKY